MLAESNILGDKLEAPKSKNLIAGQLIERIVKHKEVSKENRSDSLQKHTRIVAIEAPFGGPSYLGRKDFLVFRACRVSSERIPPRYGCSGYKQ
ncbi:MAG: hypothetical protein M1835_002938 [Candelina submexicana]|nr:MAG: hypothetical protein M1835_002938 [Candelina submexicana]